MQIDEDVLREVEAALAELKRAMWMAAEWLTHGGEDTTFGDDYRKQYQAATAAGDAALASLRKAMEDGKDG